MGSSLHRATGSARTLLQCGVSTQSQPTSCNLLYQKGVPPWAADVNLLHLQSSQVKGKQPASPWSSPGLQGNLWSSAWSISSFSYLTGLSVCGSVFLTCSHFSSGYFPQQLFPFFNRLSLRMLVLSEMSLSQMASTLASEISHVEPSGTGSIW